MEAISADIVAMLPPRTHTLRRVASLPVPMRRLADEQAEFDHSASDDATSTHNAPHEDEDDMISLASILLCTPVHTRSPPASGTEYALFSIPSQEPQP